MMLCRLLSLASCFAATAALADAPRILDVSVSKMGMYWRVSVTLDHPDTGWDHYADGWEVLAEDGAVLGTRELMHPHVHEQPFTRSLNSVVIPDGARKIFVRANCSTDGWSSDLYPVELSLGGN